MITDTKFADYYSNFVSQGAKCVLSNYDFYKQNRFQKLFNITEDKQ